MRKLMTKVWQKFKDLFKPRDLTSGNIVKGILVFMIPLLLSLLFQQLFSLTDSIIVGQNLSTYEISGINDVAPLSALALQFCIGVASGFSVVVSHKIGEKNLDAVRKSFYVQMLLCIIITVVLTVVFCFGTDFMLTWMSIAPNETDPNEQLLYQSAHDYLFIIFLGIYSYMAYNFMMANLRALGDSFTPFIFLALGVILDIFLDLLFIVPLKWGVIGSAWATVISQTLSSVACAIYTFTKYKFLRYQKGDLKVPFNFVTQHLKLGLPLGLQESILEIGIMIMQICVISFDYTIDGVLVPGAPMQVGYTIACKVNWIIMNVYMAIGSATLTYMGQNYGAHKLDRIRKGFKAIVLITIISYAFLLTIGLCVSINGAYMYLFLKPDNITPQAIHYGNLYLYTCLPCHAILAVLFICRNALQGLNKPLFPFLAGVGEMVARCGVLVPLLLIPGLLNSAASDFIVFLVYFADPAAWIIATLIMIVPLCRMIYSKKGLSRYIPL